MAERIKAASSSRVWIVVLGGRRGRPVPVIAAVEVLMRRLAVRGGLPDAAWRAMGFVVRCKREARC